MGNLFLSFAIAVSASFGLVSLSRAFDLEFYTSKILPLIPILYAIVYEILDHRKAGRARKYLPNKVEAGTAPTGVEAGITAGRIAVDVAVSFGVKFFIELFLVAVFLRFSGQTFSETYGKFSIGTVGTFLRGEHPWLTGKEGLYLLALVAVITIFVAGSWIGHTSKGNAILEGVLAGAAVTLINSMTNTLVLYRTIEEMTVRLADSMGYAMHAGFLVVLGLQVLLYGLWSGLAQTAKQSQDEKKKAKKSKK
jgi:hypothetical protein